VVFVIYQLKPGRLPFSGYLIVNSGGKPPLSRKSGIASSSNGNFVIF
jgi:hypothetical protein